MVRLVSALTLSALARFTYSVRIRDLSPLGHGDNDSLVEEARSETGSFCKVGVGFSVAFQKQPLAVTEAAKLVKARGINCVRMWSYSSEYLEALHGAGIKDVLVNVPTGELKDVDASKADAIVKGLKAFADKGMKLRVALGNEALAPWENHDGQNGGRVQMALTHMVAALKANGMGSVPVTVPFQAGILGNSYPPQAGAFAGVILDVLRNVCEVLLASGGEFTIHLYPWFARQHGLDLALGKSGNNINGVQYSGMLHQMVAATRAALSRLDARYTAIPLSIGETGWPSAGAPDATAANAREYYRNTIAAATSESLPLDPNLRTVFLFEAFDEKKKSGASHGGHQKSEEDNFGLMYESGGQKYTGLRFPEVPEEPPAVYPACPSS